MSLHKCNSRHRRHNSARTEVLHSFVLAHCKSPHRACTADNSIYWHRTCYFPCKQAIDAQKLHTHPDVLTSTHRRRTNVVRQEQAHDLPLVADNTLVFRCDLLFSAHQRRSAFESRQPANIMLKSGLDSVFHNPLINMEANYLPRDLPWVGSRSAAETLRCDIVRFSHDGSCKHEFMDLCPLLSRRR